MVSILTHNIEEYYGSYLVKRLRAC